MSFGGIGNTLKMKMKTYRSGRRRTSVFWRQAGESQKNTILPRYSTVGVVSSFLFALHHATRGKFWKAATLATGSRAPDELLHFDVVHTRSQIDGVLLAVTACACALNRVRAFEHERAALRASAVVTNDLLQFCGRADQACQCIGGW